MVEWEAANLQQHPTTPDHEVDDDDDSYNAYPNDSSTAVTNSAYNNSRNSTNYSTNDYDGGTNNNNNNNNNSPHHDNSQQQNQQQKSSPNQKRSRQKSTSKSKSPNHHRRRRLRSTNSETPEAALARLTSSYSAVMDAVGSLHKISRHVMRDTSRAATATTATTTNNEAMAEDGPPSRQTTDMLERRVGRAARQAFEDGILTDHLVMPYIPTLVRTLQTTAMMAGGGGGGQQRCESNGTNGDEYAGGGGELYGGGEKEADFASSSFITSAAPASSSVSSSPLKELAYASLVNYADLLLCGCACGLVHTHELRRRMRLRQEGGRRTKESSSTEADIDIDIGATIDVADSDSNEKLEEENSILDRGAVRLLDTLRSNAEQRRKQPYPRCGVPSPLLLKEDREEEGGDDRVTTTMMDCDEDLHIIDDDGKTKDPTIDDGAGDGGITSIPITNMTTTYDHTTPQSQPQNVDDGEREKDLTMDVDGTITTTTTIPPPPTIATTTNITTTDHKDNLTTTQPHVDDDKDKNTDLTIEGDGTATTKASISPPSPSTTTIPSPPTTTTTANHTDDLTTTQPRVDDDREKNTDLTIEGDGTTTITAKASIFPPPKSTTTITQPQPSSHDNNYHVDGEEGNTTCLWKNCEKTLGEQTKRLALVAYCDAADMDGSDPTLWFKVACAARGLGRCTALNDDRKEVDGDDDGDDGDERKEGKEEDGDKTSPANKKLEEAGKPSSIDPNTQKDISFPNDACMQDKDGNPLDADIVKLEAAATNSSLLSRGGNDSGKIDIAPPGSNITTPDIMKDLRGRRFDVKIAAALTVAAKSKPKKGRRRNKPPITKLTYRRLERYALERGMMALPPSVPPNRAICRAFREFEEQIILDDDDGDGSSDDETAVNLRNLKNHRSDYHTRPKVRWNDGKMIFGETTKDIVTKRRADLVIDLPRYSWSTLGRILMRACREGITSKRKSGWNGYTIKSTTITTTIFETHPDSESASFGTKVDDILSTKETQTLPFGSPSVRILISPVLTLPPTALWTICEFLGATTSSLSSDDDDTDDRSSDFNRFESTCRSLSVEIMGARTSMELERNLWRRQVEAEMAHCILGKVRDDENDQGTGGEGGLPVRKSLDKTKDNDTSSMDCHQTPVIKSSTNSINTGTTATTGTQPITTKVETTTLTSNTTSSSSPSPLPPPLSSLSSIPNRQRTNRSSKRVQTKLLTSGKQAERTAKRKSVEYCLVSVVLGCTADHPIYTTNLNDDTSLLSSSSISLSSFSKSLLPSPCCRWKELIPLKECTFRIQSILSEYTPQTRTTSKTKTTTDATLRSYSRKQRLSKRISDATSLAGIASLNSFIRRWGSGGNGDGDFDDCGVNSGPSDVLHRFLSHVSMNVEEVYSSEQDGVVLTSCISECFEILMTRSDKRTSLCPSWYGNEECTSKATSSSISHEDIETFAMNLLSAELRMRRCERHEFRTSDYDDDINSVKCMISYLLHFSEVLGDLTTTITTPSKNNKSYCRLLAKLQTRSHWLAAVFYTYWSRNTPTITNTNGTPHLSTIQVAERCAIQHIGHAISTLHTKQLPLSPLPSHTSLIDSINTVLPTLHLESPGRVGAHWKELSKRTLMDYRDELESSAVVSRSRHALMDLYRSFIEKKAGNSVGIDSVSKRMGLCVGELTVDERGEISVVGKELLERYDLVMEGREEGKEPGRKYEELLDDFISLHGVDLTSTSTSTNVDGGEGEGTTTSNKDEVQIDNDNTHNFNRSRWNLVWELIPTSQSSILNLGDVSKPSLISIISICLHCKKDLSPPSSSSSHQRPSLLSFLARLVVIALDRRRNLLDNHQNKKKEGPPGSYMGVGGGGGSRLSSSDDDSDSSENEYDSNNEKTMGSSATNATTLLHVAHFFMCKLTHIVGAYSSTTAPILDFCNSNDLIAATEMCVQASSCSEHLSSLERGGGASTTTPNSELLIASLSLVSRVFQCLKDGDDGGGNDDDHENSKRRQQEQQRTCDDLLVSIFAILVRAFVHERNVLPILLRSTKMVSRAEHQKLCLNRARHIEVIVIEISGILSNNPCVFLNSNGNGGGDVRESFVIAKLISGDTSLAKEGEGDQIMAVSGETRNANHRSYHIFPLAQLSESLAWFWITITSSDVIEGTATTPTNSSTSSLPTTSTVHRCIARCLAMPICAAIISFCHSTAHGQRSGNGSDASVITRSIAWSQQQQQKQQQFQQEQKYSDIFSPSDYFDSDDSAKEWGEESDESGDEDYPVIAPSRQHQYQRERQSLLRRLCRTVQCINLVFSRLCDTMASFTCKCILSPSPKGFFLPVLVVRVLTDISDFVLEEYPEERAENDDNDDNKVLPSSSNGGGEGTWATEYPFGFRDAGLQLDALLHKAYRCLHGINLISPQNSSGSTSIGAGNSRDPTLSTMDPNKSFPPETAKAAVRLYRCIVRAYANGRRSLPVDALQCVASALPPDKKGSEFRTIEEYIFKRDATAPSSCDVVESRVQEANNIDGISTTLPHCVQIERNGLDDTDIREIKETSRAERDIYLVRKGICERLAEGPIPRLGSSTSSPSSINRSSSTTENATTNAFSHGTEEREMTEAAEMALNEKTLTIIDTLNYDPQNYKSWYRAGLCLWFKADIIMDRLRRTNKPYSGDFYLPKFPSLASRQVYFQDDVYNVQSTTTTINDDGNLKCHFLGLDLRIYVTNRWSNLDMLESMQPEFGDTLNNADTGIVQELKNEKEIWHNIRSKYDMGKLAEWQQAWGGLFVSALLHMAKKCLRVASFLAERKKENMYCEISESLGTMFYMELMGSESYGYPLCVLADRSKREKAKLALSYFERAISATSAPDDSNQDDSNVVLWEVQFMIGKCQEKIAKTLQNEAWESSVVSLPLTQLYTCSMKNALQSYSLALNEANEYEEQRKSDTMVGGSSHGIIEVVYRIHASRLKVLLAAVKRPKDDRDAAEKDALLITENHWYQQPEGDSDKYDNRDNAKFSIRERVWNVLADVVGAMAYCRRERPFFHRSVYRQAQALMWAPLFDNPDSAVKDGSLAVVSASKSYKLRGLNSGPCANSAESIIKLLFDKKRPQLAAVWYSNSASPSPFIFLNDTVRKYDTLRSKYIGAYIDCMRLCKRKSALTTLISWCTSSGRDLVSFYSASAAALGSAPKQLHNRDNLLLPGAGLVHFTMRRANAALAAIAQVEAFTTASSEWTDDWKGNMRKELECAYECFLRLNCPIDDGIWQSQKFKRNLIDGRIIEIEALCDTYGILNDPTYSMVSDQLRVRMLSDQLGVRKVDTWELKFRRLQLTLIRCNEIFPVITEQYNYSRRRKKKRIIFETNIEVSHNRSGERGSELKRTCTDDSNVGNVKGAEKRTETKSDSKAAMVTRHFFIRVPEGAKEGDSLQIIVICGSSFQKKVHLTTPPGNPAKLKFRMKVPDNKSPVEVKVKKVKKRKVNVAEERDKKKERKLSH